MLFGDVEDYVLGHESLEAGVVYRHRIASSGKIRDVETPGAAGAHAANTAGFLTANHDGRARHKGTAGIGNAPGERRGQFLSETGGRQAQNDERQ